MENTQTGAIACAAVCLHHRTAFRSKHFCSLCTGKINALMERPFPGKRILPPAVSVRNTVLCGVQRKQSFPCFFSAPAPEAPRTPAVRLKLPEKSPSVWAAPSPCPARPHRFARTFCLPPSVCFLFMQANTQKTRQRVCSVGSCKYYLRNMKKSKIRFRRLLGRVSPPPPALSACPSGH